MVKTHEFACGLDLLIGDAGLAIGAAAHLRNQHTVDLYLPAPQLVKAHEQVYHRGFAGAGVADYGHLLPRLYIGGEIVDYRLILVIAEAYIFKLDLAANMIDVRGAAAVVRHFLLGEEAEHPFTGSAGRHETADSLGYLAQGVGEELYIADKRNYRAEADGSAHRERCADDAHGDIAEAADKAHQRHEHSAEKLRLPRTVVKIIVYAVELFFRLRRCAVGSYDVVARIHFLNVAVHIAEILLLLAEVLARARNDEEHQHKAEYRRADRRQCKTAARCKHYYSNAHELHDSLNERRYAGVERRGYGVNVVRDAAENVADGDLVEEFKRKLVYLLADARAHAPRKLLHDGYHDIACRAGDEVCAYVYCKYDEDGLYDKVHIYARLQSVADIIGQICKLIGRNYRQKRSDEAEYQGNDNGLVPRL